MSNRVPKYETHIRPMIRHLDRERMLGSFDLWEYGDITQPDNLRDILDRVSRPRQAKEPRGEMPPKEFGGPWPFEWIDLFKRWVDEGCPRLEQVNTNIELAIVQISTEVSSLIAKGESQGFGYSVWFEPEFNSSSPLRYSLFREPPEVPPPIGSKEFEVSIDFKDESMGSIFVNGVRVPRDRDYHDCV